jgi:hypothetical protein
MGFRQPASAGLQGSHRIHSMEQIRGLTTMNYDQEDLLRDYARRTLENLRAIDELSKGGSASPVFETTQLINSLLGLIILPVEQYFDQLPAIPKDVLLAQGWKIPKVTGDFPEVKDLCELLKNLRHAVAHFNIKFIPDNRNQVVGLVVSNRNQRNKAEILWQAEIGITELRDLLERFVGLILNPQYSSTYERCRSRNDGSRPRFY